MEEQGKGPLQTTLSTGPFLRYYPFLFAITKDVPSALLLGRLLELAFYWQGSFLKFLSKPTDTDTQKYSKVGSLEDEMQWPVYTLRRVFAKVSTRIYSDLCRNKDTKGKTLSARFKQAIQYTMLPDKCLKFTVDLQECEGLYREAMELFDCELEEVLEEGRSLVMTEKGWTGDYEALLEEFRALARKCKLKKPLDGNMEKEVFDLLLFEHWEYIKAKQYFKPLSGQDMYRHVLKYMQNRYAKPEDKNMLYDLRWVTLCKHSGLSEARQEGMNVRTGLREGLEYLYRQLQGKGLSSAKYCELAREWLGKRQYAYTLGTLLSAKIVDLVLQDLDR
jgi:hypothetical protein